MIICINVGASNLKLDVEHVLNSHVSTKSRHLEVAQLWRKHPMVEGLLLYYGGRTGKELNEAVILSTLGRMHYSIVRDQVLSVQSDDVILPCSYSSRTH
jgi:hypothetical protein